LFQAIALVVFAHFTMFKEAGLNDGDSITHYLISRYAWHYPHLFLDNWGKPFFILFSSPFAQFGYKGIQVFNITCGILSAWFCYRIADKIGMPFSYLASVFLFFTPVYFNALPSGLTEIFFGLVLIASICLIAYDRFILATLLISFLPFCRSEGILLLPVVGLFLLIKKQYFPIPFLITGFLLYSIIGYFVLNDFLWTIHTNPYHSRDLYGHGTLWHFVESYVPIFGNLLGILFLIATLFYSVCNLIILKAKKQIRVNFLFEVILLWLIVMTYLTAHSIFWYKGLFASAGLWRVMAAIAPPFSLVCMRGMNYGINFFKDEKLGQLILNVIIELLYTILSFVEYILRKALWIVVIFIVIYQLLHYFQLPQRIVPAKVAVREACDWVKENNLRKRKIFYSEPFTKICLNLDPYDTDKSEELMYVWHGKEFGNDMPKGSIIIWEPGLGPREDGIPLTNLENDKRFKLLKTFDTPHETGKPSEYIVYLFEKQ